MKKIQIGIIGSAGAEEYPSNNSPSQKIFDAAYELGKLVGKEGYILITGGKGGIMEAASRGAKEVGGITVGVVKGSKRYTANKYVDVEVVSGMEGCGEETMLVLMCDALIAIGGGAGTLQELSIAYRNKKPIITLRGYEGWGERLKDSYLDTRNTIKIEGVNSIKEAFKTLKQVLNKDNK